MPGDLHQELVNIGAKWLKRQGFSVVATELVTAGTNEQADDIGFRSECSVVLEAKTSRADFFADRAKPHRSAGGLGVYRFYIVPDGLLRVEEIPKGWGLLYVTGTRVKEALRPRGNLWPRFGEGPDDWRAFQHQPDVKAERGVLFSLARRNVTRKSESSLQGELAEAQKENRRLASRNDALMARVEELMLQVAILEGASSPAGNEPLIAIPRKVS